MKYINEYQIIYNFPKLFKKLSMFLVYSSNIRIREKLAKQRYRLDMLFNDIDWRVRVEVARQGYELNILINDPNSHVKMMAKLIKEKQFE